MGEKQQGEGELCVTGLIIHRNSDTKSRCRFCAAAKQSSIKPSVKTNTKKKINKKIKPKSKTSDKDKVIPLTAKVFDDSKKYTNHSVLSMIYQKVMDRLGKTFSEGTAREKKIFDLDFIYILVNSRAFLKKNLRELYDNFGLGVTEDEKLEINQVPTPIGKLSVKNLTEGEHGKRKVLFLIVGNDGVERKYTTEITPNTLNYIEINKWNHPVPVS